MIEQPATTDGQDVGVLADGLGAVLHAVADGVTVQDTSGRIVYANAAAAQLIGFADADALLAATPAEVLDRFDLLDEDGRALPPEALPGRVALTGESPDAMTVRFRIRATGEERWAVVRATPLLAADGQSRYAINAFQDVTARVLAEREARAAAARSRQLVESLPDIAWVADAHGVLESANARWWQYAGEPVSGPDGRPTALESLVHPDDRPRLDASWAAARAAGDALDETIRLQRPDGVSRWFLVRAVPMRDEAGAVSGWVGTSTDIDEAKRTAEHNRLIAAASERLDESLDPAETVRAAGAIAVPDLADICVIDLLGDDGRTTRAAIVVADAGLQARADDLLDYPSEPGTGGLMGGVLETGRSMLVEDVSDEVLVARTKDERHRAILRDLDIRSALAVPLAARGEVLGAMALVHGRSGRRYRPDDLPLVEELARRVGLALANARLYVAEQDARRAAERERDRTQRLQRLTGALAEATSVETVAALVLAEARMALGASAGSIYQLEADGAALVPVAAEGYTAATMAAFQRIPVDAPLPLAEAIRTGEALWFPDTSVLLDRATLLSDAIRRSPNRAAIAVPLRAEGRPLGTLGLSFTEAREISAADREFTLAVAELAAQGMARAMLAIARTELLLALDAQRARLEAVLEQAPVGVVIADAATGRLVLGNAEVDRIFGRPFQPTEDLVDGIPAAPQEGTPLTDETGPLARALRGEVVEAEEVAIQRGDASPATILAWAAPIRDGEGAVTSAVVAFTDITERRMAQENQRFLAQASEVLGSSLDYEETLRRIAELAVPRIADWVSIELVDDDGELTGLAVAHVDPRKVRLARELRVRYPPDPASAQGSYAVVRTGRAELVTEIPSEMVRELLHDDPERLAIVEELQLHSYMSVPLRAGGRILGVMTFVGAESGRRYVQADLDFAENLAARAAAAIENARLFRDADRFRQLVDATLDVVFVIDPDTLRIAHANLGATLTTGIDAGHLVGSPLDAVLPDVEAARLRSLVGPLAKGAADARTMTLALEGPSGPIPVEVLFQRIELVGEPDRLVAVARDITDRVEAQARLQRLAEAEHARAAELDAVIHAMGEAVFVCAADGTIVLANPAAEGMFPDVDERTYAEVLANLDDPTGIAPALGGHGGPVELRAKGEDERWIELSTYPVAGRPATGTGPETIVVGRDITAARQRQQVRDTFVGVLSHELRTPVTTIFGGSKILARQNSLSEEQRREVFEDIATEAERLHRLVEDVIALNRFGEEGGEEVGQDPVLLQRILPSVIRAEEIRWPGVTFEAAIPAGLPTVVADRTYVEQIVRNLLSNAAKYGGAGTTVRVTVDATADEVRVHILDDGPGFPAHEAERLFDLFFRSTATSSKASGAGIGLFVTARLIRAMGGRVWAIPREGGGAEFGFALRVMADD